MSNFQAALALLDQVESAIADGDLETANQVVAHLKPLLASTRVDELTALKSRIDGLNLTVRRKRQSHKEALKKVMTQNQAIDQYQAIANRG